MFIGQAEHRVGGNYEQIEALVDCTGATPITVFSVSGLVAIKVLGIPTEALTTSDAITAALGVASNTIGLIAQVADATDLTIGLLWHDATPDKKLELLSVIAENIISEDVILTTTGTVTAGTIKVVALWWPLDKAGKVEVA